MQKYINKTLSSYSSKSKLFQCLLILPFKIRAKPEIEAGLCNKEVLVLETSHSITVKRSNGDPSNLTNGSSLEKTGKEVSRQQERGGGKGVQNEKRMRNCHPGRGSVSAANGFMGGFPNLPCCSGSLWSGLHLPQVESEIVPYLLTGKHECG
ncbi:hypothetical protein CEXT_741181 [Caerostris extrusa]|uniref:Uncharacterized protein n=1 Tax=Caerostris extrusa TaxID=172846 RepID=A0AAV4SSV3_CAEEX|nr:hypothetical protein CEXT_741181 [Caerostris extrusa]